jgi:tRNA-specific 2-thiouridylase
VDCNSTVKFGALLGRARHLYECDAVATGHYARVAADEDADAPGGRRYRLLTGADRDKDQSYFLYGLRQDQLARTRFPLGELEKPEVREVARRHGLVTAEKPESQEICFVPGGDYRDALRERAGWEPTAGPLLDSDGRELGIHQGAASYTVGQRRGVGVALGEARYVKSIDAVQNVVTLGRREELQRRTFEVEAVSFVAGEPPAREAFHASVRIRHRATPVPATFEPATPDEPLRGGRWRVTVEQPVWAAAPGQAAVFYVGDEVLGGGRIASG